MEKQSLIEAIFPFGKPEPQLLKFIAIHQY